MGTSWKGGSLRQWWVDLEKDGGGMTPLPTIFQFRILARFKTSFYLTLIRQKVFSKVLRFASYSLEIGFAFFNEIWHI